MTHTIGLIWFIIVCCVSGFTLVFMVRDMARSMIDKVRIPNVKENRLPSWRVLYWQHTKHEMPEEYPHGIIRIVGKKGEKNG